MPILVLRLRRTSVSDIFARSSPSSTTLPPTTPPRFFGISPMIERAVIVLPEPLSPTIPRVSPCRMSKLTRFTGLMVPSREYRWVSSSLMLSTGSDILECCLLLLPANLPRVESVVESVAQEVEPDDRDGQSQARHEHQMWISTPLE